MRIGAKRLSWSIVSRALGLAIAVGTIGWALRIVMHHSTASSQPTDAAERQPDISPVESTHSHQRGPHWADRAALVVALMSTVVSIIALVVTISLAERPYPADPTQLPGFGTPQEPEHIASAADSYRLFDFLRENAGRKVRLYVGFSMDGPFRLSESDGLTIPMPDCPSNWDSGLITCNTIHLMIRDVSDQRVGLVFQHGENVLTGYFADEGSLGIWTGSEVVAITPLTAVEAVS
jgi:hypothetical protein